MSGLIDSLYLTEIKQTIRDRPIPWEGLARADTLTADETNMMKLLDKQEIGVKKTTILEKLDLSSITVLTILNKVERDDVTKNLLVLINDLLLEIPEFTASLLGLSSIDATLPYSPFVKSLGSDDESIRILSLYNLTLLLTASHGTVSDDSILDKIYDLNVKLIESTNLNLNFISIQLLQSLISTKQYKLKFWTNQLKHFPPLLALLKSGKGDIQLKYNLLLIIWILTFDVKISKDIISYYAEIVETLLKIAKESIKEKVVRLSIGTISNLLKNEPKSVKILLIGDGLSSINNLLQRKWADDELKEDLTFILNTLNEYVVEMTSFDEYLTELDNGLLNWSPTHKSVEFWIENSFRFKENNWKLTNKLLNLLKQQDNNSKFATIILNDLQFLIKNLKSDIIDYLNKSSGKIVIMEFMNSDDNELKYESLKTTQLLVSHSY